MIDNNEIKCLLLYIELIQIFESIDISSLTTYKLEFLSEEFEDFMELLTRWNLSDTYSSDILKFAYKICYDNIILSLSIKQGHQLLDRINVLHISFKKVPIMIYDEKTYYLYYYQIFDVIKELLSNQNIF